MALITQKDVNAIKAALEELAPFTEEPITYRKYDHTEPGDPVIGAPAQDVFVDTSTTASVRELTLEEVQVSGGAYLLGDREFTIRMLANPDYRDRIVYAGTSYKPKSIGKMFLGEVLWWEVRAGKE